MPIKAALVHQTTYTYDRPVALSPHVIRLRPAPHCRTPIDAFSLKIQPENHFINWQQDPFGNYLARIVFPTPATRLQVSVDLIADMTVINPFDFFLEEAATEFPFQYDADLAQDLTPFLQPICDHPDFLEFRRRVDVRPRRTVSFLVDLNVLLQQSISYLIRMEPGVQSPEETLKKRSGSCRDSAWLLVHLLRSFGLAARFVSGYLIQLTADQQPLEGPAGPAADFTDLHAWTEVYLPGAGWVGLDPTSGLFTGEGHIPLAATPAPQSAAPISGAVDPCEVSFDVHMQVTRIHEDPRVTLPYTEQVWERIDACGQQVDQRLADHDVRLTMGGEPTFVSIDDMEGAEWNSAAVGPRKQQLSDQLIRRLRQRFAPGGLLHYGQGKWYPGESLPRWAYTCLWRRDGQPIWNNPALLAGLHNDHAPQNGPAADEHAAGQFICALASRLNVEQQWIRPAYEDVLHLLQVENRTPVDVSLRDFDPDSDEDRRRLTRALQRGIARPAGFVLPLSR
ncbi:MAG TPA: IMP dehydrogenase, partial [Planctomycetaceae bacterium]|nr:IMP dehydrogenase [Planctomycetaceae bacterium]